MDARRTAVLAAGLPGALLAALGGCTLLVGTGDLAEPGSADATVPEASSSDATGSADAEAGAPVDPCAAPNVLCETFDGIDPLAAYDIDKDPSGSVAIDDAISLSPPRSARFTIEPSGALSADAAVTMLTNGAVEDFVFEGGVHIERKEPNESADLLVLGKSKTERLVLDQLGALSLDGEQLGTVAPVPLGRWIPVRIEARVRVAPASVIVSVDGKEPVTITLPAPWAAASAFARLGVLDAKAPTTGWIVRWDDIVIRKL